MTTALVGYPEPVHVAISLADMTAIAESYVIEQPERVVAFLALHPGLAEVLAQAPGHIRSAFGSSPMTLALEPGVYEPERVELNIHIHTDLGAREAFECMKVLRNEWWREAAGATDDLVHIEID